MTAVGLAEPRATSLQGDVAPRAQDRRPVYLGLRVRGRVDIEGPAFRVRSARRADARFPFARVSRIISGTGMDWSAEALRACFERGIPVIVVDASGKPVGSLMPAFPQPSSFAEAVAELLDRPDWTEIYGCWLRAARMRVLAAWRAERQAHGDAVAAPEFRELVRAYVYASGKAASELLGEAAGICRGALHAIAAQALLRWRLKAVFWAAGGGRFDLLADLAGLLAVRVRLEALAGKLHEDADRALLALARRVREVLAEWR